MSTNPEKAVMASCSSIPSIGIEKMWGARGQASQHAALLPLLPEEEFPEQRLRYFRASGLYMLPCDTAALHDFFPVLLLPGSQATALRGSRASRDRVVSGDEHEFARATMW
jgi:hypothetical protein